MKLIGLTGLLKGCKKRLLREFQRFWIAFYIVISKEFERLFLHYFNGIKKEVGQRARDRCREAPVAR